MRRVIHSCNGDGDSRCRRVDGSVIDLEREAIATVVIGCWGVCVSAGGCIDRYRAMTRVSRLGKGKSAALRISASKRSRLGCIFICRR